MSIDATATHLAPDALQRMLDGEGDFSERASAKIHLRQCATCAAEMKALETQAALVSEWLERAAFEAAAVQSTADRADVGPWRSTGRRASNNLPSQSWLRAAAVLALIATPVAASSGLREWIAERIGAREVEPATEVTADPVPAATAQAAGVIRFSPAPGSFDVVIASLQQTGGLDIVAGNGSEAVLEINGVAGAGPIVSEHTLRINNERASVANYTLRVPASVTRVIVRLPGRTPQGIEAMELRQGVQIPLMH